MTKVRIQKHNGSIVSVECDGHTGYGVEGEDIVCSALSSIVQTAALGLMQVAGIDLDYEVREEDGYLKFTLPPLSKERRRDADMILNTLYLGICLLIYNYLLIKKVRVARTTDVTARQNASVPSVPTDNSCLQATFLCANAVRKSIPAPT